MTLNIGVQSQMVLTVMGIKGKVTIATAPAKGITANVNIMTFTNQVCLEINAMTILAGTVKGNGLMGLIIGVKISKASFIT